MFTSMAQIQSYTDMRQTPTRVGRCVSAHAVLLVLLVAAREREDVGDDGGGKCSAQECDRVLTAVAAHRSVIFHAVLFWVGGCVPSVCLFPSSFRPRPVDDDLRRETCGRCCSFIGVDYLLLRWWFLTMVVTAK